MFTQGRGEKNSKNLKALQDNKTRKTQQRPRKKKHNDTKSDGLMKACGRIVSMKKHTSKWSKYNGVGFRNSASDIPHSYVLWDDDVVLDTGLSGVVTMKWDVVKLSHD